MGRQINFVCAGGLSGQNSSQDSVFPEGNEQIRFWIPESTVPHK